MNTEILNIEKSLILLRLLSMGTFIEERRDRKKAADTSKNSPPSPTGNK